MHQESMAQPQAGLPTRITGGGLGQMDGMSWARNGKAGELSAPHYSERGLTHLLDVEHSPIFADVLVSFQFIEFLDAQSYSYEPSEAWPKLESKSASGTVCASFRPRSSSSASRSCASSSAFRCRSSKRFQSGSIDAAGSR